MVDDPRRFLGISEDASGEEIKWAYREKERAIRRQYDPEDPRREQRQNELYEAYGRVSGIFEPLMEEPERPQAMEGDRGAIRQAIDFINMKRYEYAGNTLSGVPVSERNARWHYLNALIYHDLDSPIAALGEAARAIRMDPEVSLYRRVFRCLQSNGIEYDRRRRMYGRY